jgi:hypothetical protein
MLSMFQAVPRGGPECKSLPPLYLALVDCLSASATSFLTHIETIHIALSLFML